MPTSALSERVRQAILGLSAQMNRRLTNAVVGQMVARYMGRDEAFSAAAVSHWINGAKVPPLDVIAALAAITGQPAAWLAFGESVETERRAPTTSIELYEEVTSVGATRKQKPSASVKKRRA